MAAREDLQLREVEVQALDAARLEPLIGPERIARYEGIAEAAELAMRGRTLLNINSTAAEGGVAEMLQRLLAYGRGAGLDIRWLVIRVDAGFFEITKRIHGGLYGSLGDGGALGEAERSHYEQTLRRHAEELLALVRPSEPMSRTSGPSALGCSCGHTSRRSTGSCSRGGHSLPPGPTNRRFT